MNWEAVGAIGEIVGAIAVVLSLVYLAAQIRQNTKLVEEQCRAQKQSSLLGARSAFTEWRSLIIQSSMIAVIWRRGNIQWPGRLAYDPEARPRGSDSWARPPIANMS